MWSEEIEREMRNRAKEGKRGIGSFGVCDCGLKKLREKSSRGVHNQIERRVVVVVVALQLALQSMVPTWWC